MKTEIWTAVWSVDTKIDEKGNRGNALGTLSMQERMNLLGAVVKQAYERIAGGFIRSLPDSISDVPPRWALMFVAPEYLFARSDTAHLITEAEKREVVLRLQALSRHWPELVLIPGTIAWKKPAVRPVDERFRKDPQTGKRTGSEKTRDRLGKFSERVTREGVERRVLAEHVVDQRNAGLGPNARRLAETTRREDVIVERDKAVDDAARAVAKMKSNLALAPQHCFLARNTLYAFYNGAEVGRYHKRADYKEVFAGEDGGGFVIFEPGVPGDGCGSRFEVKGIRFGVEICKDHAVGYLSQRSIERPDVHVLVSAAVQLVEQHVFVRPGSFLVHASSDPECSGVWRNTGAAVEKVAVEEEPTGFGGSKLLYAPLRFETAEVPRPELEWPV